MNLAVFMVDRRGPTAVVGAVCVLVALAGCVYSPSEGDYDALPLGFEVGTPMDLGPVAAVGYIDADEWYDVYAGGANGRLFLGTADGTFVAGPTDAVCAGCDVTAVSVADLDDDGDGDIVLGTAGGVKVVWQGPSGYERTLWGPTEPIAALTVADLDNDGDSDIVAAPVGAPWFVLWGDENSTFKDAEVGREAVPLGGFALAQLDDDRLLDLVGYGAEVDAVAVWHNDPRAPGVLLRAPDVATGGPQDIVSLAPTDLDQDQDIDLLVGTVGGPLVLTHGPRHGLAPEGMLPLTEAGAAGALPVDVDMDGLDDIVALDGGAIVVSRQEPDGTFARGPRIDPGIDAVGLLALDMDRDGRMDLLALAADGTAVPMHNAFPPAPGAVGRAIGNETAKPAVGTTVSLTSGTAILHQQVGGLAASQLGRAPDLHFALAGLGDGNDAALAILWPSGTLQFRELDGAALDGEWILAVESQEELPWADGEIC